MNAAKQLHLWEQPGYAKVLFSAEDWNEVAAGSGHHDLAPVCKYTGTPTPPEPTPAPVPDSRDTVTVAPEEWDYLLAL